MRDKFDSVNPAARGFARFVRFSVCHRWCGNFTSVEMFSGVALMSFVRCAATSTTGWTHFGFVLFEGGPVVLFEMGLGIALSDIESRNHLLFAI